MRLALWAGSLAAGIAVALALDLRAFAIVALAAVGLAALLVAGVRARSLAGASLAFAVGAILGHGVSRPRPLAPAVAAAVERDGAVEIFARVARGPEWSTRGARLVLELERVDGAPAHGTLALSVIGGWPDFGPGERLVFRAALHEIRGTCNPGVPDPALALRAAGIDVLAGVPSADALRRVGPAEASLRRAAFEARRAMRAAIDRVVPGAPGAFLKTAVLGDRRGVGDEVEAGFTAAGATHVLSVSGLHLAAVVAVVFLFARVVAGAVPALPLYVDPRAVAAALALPVLVFFTLLTGEAVATERSAVMLAVGMGGIVLGRPVSAAPAIAAAALVILAFGPLRLYDDSFQLSVASVAGIAFLARRLGPSRGRRPRSLPARTLEWRCAIKTGTRRRSTSRRRSASMRTWPRRTSTLAACCCAASAPKRPSPTSSRRSRSTRATARRGWRPARGSCSSVARARPAGSWPKRAPPSPIARRRTRRTRSRSRRSATAPSPRRRRARRWRSIRRCPWLTGRGRRS